MRALFVGRFQPFHLGHLSVVQKILTEMDEIIIAIGSAENNFLSDNPFTASERMELIRIALDEAKIPREKYWIVAVRNIDNYALWVEHLTKLVPKFEVVYSGSAIVQELFKKHGKFKINSVEEKIKINATIVREKISTNQDWEKLVPLATVKLIKEFGGEERLNNC